MKVAVRTALVLVVNVMRIYFYERENSMNREMIKALKNKYIYVDIDGTIAEYRFNNHVNAKDGTTNGQTMKEIENHIFLYSRPLKTVIQTLKRAKKEGIWICGAIISPVELLDKIVWLEENCKGIEFNEMALLPSVMFAIYIDGIYYANRGMYVDDATTINCEYSLNEEVLSHYDPNFVKGL